MGQSWRTSPLTATSSKTDANYGKNDRSQYSTNMDLLTTLKTYMPPCAQV